MIEVIKTVLAVIGGLTVASAVAMAIIIFKRCGMDATTRAIQGRKDRRMSDTISRQAAIDGGSGT